ncbi:MAG: Uma2 family endonuclease [Betaproteobacteria bacterium]
MQSPLVVGERSVPQPDIALLKPRADNYFGSHPGPADVLLVVEVSDTTSRFDLSTKIPLYARAGIAEAWVFDLGGRTLRVFRDPDPGGYRTSFTASGETASVRALCDVAVVERAGRGPRLVTAHPA